ncbi:MAG: N-acetyltransferase [Pseudanabaena frigida]|uniref:N-acetyltransferase n=1 Tax=Pseudanabaena frigida TaxID=945775 RepID=A0A2W4XR33_9CYAN|nr:MAG: N-acetyltransferase [Pseudanabaena frigida]
MASKVSINNQVIIRAAEIKDAERIAILADQLGYVVTNQQAQERIYKIQNNDNHVLYIATLNNENMIGWVHACIYDSIVIQTPALLLGLVVDQDHRFQGIGRLLMEQIENWTSQSGGEGVLLRSNIKRKEAHLFYEKIGYTNIKQSLTFYKSLVV